MNIYFQITFYKYTNNETGTLRVLCKQVVVKNQTMHCLSVKTIENSLFSPYEMRTDTVSVKIKDCYDIQQELIAL